VWSGDFGEKGVLGFDKLGWELEDIVVGKTSEEYCIV